MANKAKASPSLFPHLTMRVIMVLTVGDSLSFVFLFFPSQFIDSILSISTVEQSDPVVRVYIHILFFFFFVFLSF